MLQDEDLQRFINAYERSQLPTIQPVQPSTALVSKEGLFASEIWRLVCSLQIAATAGDAPQAAQIAAQMILDDTR